MNAYRKGVRVQATVAPVISKDIDDLLETGLFGRTRAEIVQRFIYDGIRRAVPFLRAKRQNQLPVAREAE